MGMMVQLAVALVISGALALCGRWLDKDLSALAGGDVLDGEARERAAVQRKLKRILQAAAGVLAVVGCLAAVLAPAWLYLAVLMGIPSLALVGMFRAVNGVEKQKKKF